MYVGGGFSPCVSLTSARATRHSMKPPAAPSRATRKAMMPATMLSAPPDAYLIRGQRGEGRGGTEGGGEEGRGEEGRGGGDRGGRGGGERGRGEEGRGGGDRGGRGGGERGERERGEGRGGKGHWLIKEHIVQTTYILDIVCHPQTTSYPEGGT